MSFYLSNSFSYLMLDNTYTLVYSQYYSYFPYIINFISPSYMIIYIPIEIYKKENHIKRTINWNSMLFNINFLFDFGYYHFLCKEKRDFKTNDFDISDENDETKLSPHQDLPQNEQNYDNDNSTTEDLNFWL